MIDLRGIGESLMPKQDLVPQNLVAFRASDDSCALNPDMDRQQKRCGSWAKDP